MGGLLGFFYLTALILQTIGLQRTSPGVSGFITGMSVAMVPFLYWAVARRSPGKWQIVGALVATVGLAALSLQGDFTIRWGDAITLVGTLFYALHIMTTGFFAPKVQPTTLAVTQMIVSTAALAVLTPFFVHITLDLPWQVWAAVVWTALSGTIYAFFIQSWAQRYTTSTHAAILLGFESVFAALAGHRLRHGHAHLAPAGRRLADDHRRAHHRAAAVEEGRGGGDRGGGGAGASAVDAPWRLSPSSSACGTSHGSDGREAT